MSDHGTDHITGPLGKSRCDCNGKRARCSRCVCAKAKRPCTNCHPINHDSCHNPHLLTVSQPPTQLGSQVSLQQLNCHPQQLPISNLQLSAPPSQSTFSNPPLTPALVQAVQPSLSTTEELTTHSHSFEHTLKHKKACVVHGCSELISPTMWRHHLGLHAQGLFFGVVPPSWLAEQDLFVCPNCLLLVANSHHSSHQRKCSHSFNAPASCSDEVMDPPWSLPTLADVFQAKCNTIRHIPSRDKQAFAQVLSSTLMAVVHENSEQAWLRLLMLPKCVLFSPKRRKENTSLWDRMLSQSSSQLVHHKRPENL